MRPFLALATVAVLVAGGCSGSGDDTATAPPVAATTEHAVPPLAVPSAPAAATAPRTAAPAGDLLLPAAHGDGDSWRDTAGREYRLGMVNAPELDECFGAEASAERTARTADGFRAAVYAHDGYGRAVSVVTTPDGTNLNVHLARHGFVDDRYLAEFRDENPGLAAELDAAFAAARAERRGLWSACRSGSAAAPAAQPVPLLDAPAAAGDGCHPDYAPCVPVKGDGSGQGGANDLDCGDVDGPVRLRAARVDPYRLDGDGNGTGCDA